MNTSLDCVKYKVKNNSLDGQNLVVRRRKKIGKERDRFSGDFFLSKGERIREITHLLEVASGKRSASLYLAGGKIVNVYSGEVYPANLAIAGKRIAYVGLSRAMVGKETKVMDLSSHYLIPGFFDPHAHTDLFYNPASFANEVIKTGTTTVFSDSHDLVNAAGISALEKLLEEAQKYPLKFFFGLPASSPPYPKIEGEERHKQASFLSLLKNKRILGLSEITSWARIIHGDKGLLSRMSWARSLGKKVEGHTSGASYEKLNLLSVSGITSCHESVKEEDLQHRLRVGLSVMLRHGSIRKDLDKLSPFLKKNPDLQYHQIMLTPDGLFPQDILKEGYMNFVVREAIKYGLPPIRAIQMATLNPAIYFSLDGELGSIAPYRLADICALPDLYELKPHLVIERGRIMARDGELLGEPAPLPSFRSEGNPFTLSPLSLDIFKIPSKAKREVTVPVIEVKEGTITRKKEERLPVIKGLIQPSPLRDILKIVYIQRNGKKIGRGFVSGLGIKGGSFASSCGHDTHEIMVIGEKDKEMLRALEALVKMKGGIVVVKGKEIIYSLPLPLGGIMSEFPLKEVAASLEKLKKLLKTLGSKLPDPLTSIIFLPFTSILELRITISGVYAVRESKIIFP